MPSRHIDENTWGKVEKETVKAVISANSSIKETEVLRLLILKGLESINETDYKRFIKRKKG